MTETLFIEPVKHVQHLSYNKGQVMA